MEKELKKYEIDYLLSPAISEEHILSHAAKITSVIEDAKGIIGRVEEPKKRKLSYEVRKEKNAYFGWITFQMAPGALPMAEKKIKGLDLLRFMILESTGENIAPQRLRTIPSRAAAPHPIPRESEKMDEKLDLEALDKKLEEILGK